MMRLFLRVMPGLRMIVFMLTVFLITMGGAVMLMKLLRAMGTFEFVALAGNANQGNGHKKDRE